MVDYARWKDRTLSEESKAWLLEQAKDQQKRHAARLIERAQEVQELDPLRYFRRFGLDDMCPQIVPDEVLQWLAISDEKMHFYVRSDPGNEGWRLEIGQGNREWDYVPDPWREQSANPDDANS